MEKAAHHKDTEELKTTMQFFFHHGKGWQFSVQKESIRIRQPESYSVAKIIIHLLNMYTPPFSYYKSPLLLGSNVLQKNTFPIFVVDEIVS